MRVALCRSVVAPQPVLGYTTAQRFHLLEPRPTTRVSKLRQSHVPYASGSTRPKSVRSERHTLALSSDHHPPLPEDVVALQHRVQRKLGRCLIRLQQYERLLKALVADHDISGPASTLMDIRAARVEALSKKTLGHLVGELTGNILKPDSPDSDKAAADDVPSDIVEPHLRLQFTTVLAAERYEETLTALGALVELRNELVHHFLEKHDIWTNRGCVAAEAFLDACYEQIDGRYLELHGWAKHSVEARAHIASLMQTTEFEDLMFHGILPGGAGVNWECSTIVGVLRKAESSLSRNGWTPLADAIAFARKTHPKHTPGRYGCSSWRQVLHESQQFLVRKERASSPPSTQIWYRSKPL